MAEVVITFNQRSYRFACSEAEVGRLRELTDYVKAKLEKLSEEHGAVGDERIALMAAVLIADELFDARADIDQLLDGNEAGDGAQLSDSGSDDEESDATNG